MGQEPQELRDEIEQTRARMTDTVDAIGYKADVKGRAGDYVSDKKDALAGRAQGLAEAADSVVSRVTGAMPDPRAAKDAAASTVERTARSGRQAGRTAQSNPLGLALGGVAAGFLLGLLLPSTRIEDEKVGEVADDLKDRVKETGQEALDHGKQVAQETARVAMQGAKDAAQTAVETAKESGQEHAGELKETAQGHAEALPGVGGFSDGPQQGAATSGVGGLEQHGPIGGPPPVHEER